MLNRREAIAAGLGLVLGGVAPSAGRPGDNEASKMCREKPARFAAEWEVMSLRHNCPNTWQSWKYSTGVQWDKARFMLFGVGAPEHVEAEYAKQRAAWSDRGLIEAAVTDDGRAWALLVEGQLSDELREELRQGEPSHFQTMQREHRNGQDPILKSLDE